jgi:hypothetical protein
VTSIEREDESITANLGDAGDLATATFFCAAPDGLKVGDPVLPRLGLPEIPMPTQTSVRLDLNEGIARRRAATLLVGGAVYEVKPMGPVTTNVAGERRARAARVVGLRGAASMADLEPSGLGLGRRINYPAPPYFHGGAPGLEVGDRILPPLWTDEPAHRGEERTNRDHNQFRVWLASTVEVAWTYAYRLDGGGDLYEAQPIGAAQFWETTSVSAVVAESALVVAVIARGVDTPVPETTDPRPPELRT